MATGRLSLTAVPLRRWSSGRMLLTLAMCLVGWALVAGLGLMVGSTGFGWQWAFRGEVVLLASLIGAALGAAGVVYQAILRNPLADPYLLGASSGAMLGAYLWRVSAGAVGTAALLTQAGTQQMFAFAGAVVSVGVVLLLASRRGRIEPVTLILVGVIVNAFNGSIFLLLNAVVREMPGTEGVLTFLVGGIQTNLTLQQQLVPAGLVAVGWVVMMVLAGQLNAAVVGEDESRSLGVRIVALRWVGLVLASLVTASAVAVSGPIGFVGLVAPHMARLVVGDDQRRLLPVATATGAGLLVLADAVSRFLAQPELGVGFLPVGVLTGLLGGPFFLYLLWRQR